MVPSLGPSHVGRALHRVYELYGIRTTPDFAGEPYGEADASADADDAGEADARAEPDAPADSAGPADPDGSADGLTDGAAVTDGSGSGVGSGMKRDGMAAIDSTMISTKMPSTIRIHGRASVSLRGGREPG